MNLFRSLSLVLFLTIALLAALFYRNDVAQASDEHSEVELAEHMGYLQRYSQKLGYAIEGKNLELSDFYLHEIEEILEGLEKIEKYDGHKIAENVKIHVKPLVEGLEKVVKKSEWQKSKKMYESFIAGCNSCHMATEHSFIKILPASGKSPFNQKFEKE